MFRCKASDIVKNEAYILYAIVMNDELNVADEHFWLHSRA
jgi:hypothetical protein